MLGFLHEGIKGFGYLLAVFHAAHLVAEVGGEFPETAEFLQIGLIVDTIDSGWGGGYSSSYVLAQYQKASGRERRRRWSSLGILS